MRDATRGSSPKGCPELTQTAIPHSRQPQANPASAAWINASWGIMEDLAQTQAGRDTIATTLRVCDPLTDPTNVTSTVFNWLASAIGFMAMGDYPYPAEFLGPLPAWPVNVSAGACARLGR